MMRAFVMQGFGSIQKASLGSLPKPECRPDDLLVRVVAAGVNPTDWKEMDGNLVQFYPPYAANWAPGFDGAGIVEEIGCEVQNFAVGDRVVFMSDRRGGQCGTFAEYVRVSHTTSAKAPTSISLTATASIPIAGLTAYQALFRDDMGAIDAGKSVLIHGASGGLGSFATTLAHAAGAKIAVTCRPENADYLRGLGADCTIDYTQAHIAEVVREWMPQGVDVVLDATSGGTNTALLNSLGNGGRFVVIATITDDGDIPAVNDQAQRRGQSVHFLILDHLTVAADLVGIVKLIDEKHMSLPAIATYSLDRAGDALLAMRAGKVRGKLVVQIADQ